jgi:Zc3h12a-like Ribonuclease NYN domain/FHA domain
VVSAFTVVLDAANIAFTRHGQGNARFMFRRVEEVRDRWLRERGGAVHAVIDASAYRRMSDRSTAVAAAEDGWLETATGDADDSILELADKFDAAIVSNDNFTYAREDYPWLQGCVDRVFSVSWHSGQLSVQRRVLRVATKEEIDKARREKAEKAGIRHDLGDRTWRCTAPPDECEHGGRALPHSLLRKKEPDWYCTCGYPAEELYVETEDVPLARPPVLDVLHNRSLQSKVTLGPTVTVLGRGGPSRPHVHDVTAGLPAGDAKAISREHLEVFLDDDGNPIVRHLAENNTTFLNPRTDERGLPIDNRLADNVDYLLSEADELLLGGKIVWLVVSIPREA